ncbi:MAG: hypothetical protein ABJG41_12505 [Cyclobacteriaceae bacterium]
MKRILTVLTEKWPQCLMVLLAISVSGCSNSSSHTLPDPLEAGWKGQSVCEVLEENTEVRVLKCTFEPGVGHEKHYHVPHVGYTLQGGKFRITSSGKTKEVDVPTGSTFSNEEVTTHEVLNIGKTKAEFLIIEYK